MATGLVRPKATTVPPEVAPEETPAAPEANLPDEILQIPAMQALFAGEPPALSASIQEFQKRPEAKLIAKHSADLRAAGIGRYRSLSGDLGVLFNQLKISGEQIRAADQAGQLAQIAPPFDQVNDMVSKSGENNPVLRSQGPPGGAAGAPVPEVPQAGAIVPPAPAGAQRKAMSERAKNLQPTAPTKGARPGAGRLLNQILKPVL